MPYDFDSIIDRKGTDCLKYDGGRLRLPERDRDLDLLPLWVADMDFALPPEVMNQFGETMERGVFGYTFAGDEYKDSVRRWLERRWGWHVDSSWMIQTPGVVFALACAIQAFTEKGDSVIIQQPVYYPFADMTIRNGRNLVNSELVFENGRYSIDFEDFERKVERENVKLFILCNPHNPVGRAWAKNELIQLGEICLKHDVIVVSDEIHGDFVWVDEGHCPFANLSSEFAQNSVICTSPSKTFNIAGMQASNIIIPNKKMRKSFAGSMGKIGLHGISLPALAMVRACYDQGEAWLDHLKSYLMENLAFLNDYCTQRIPELQVLPLEATYLPWIDCSGMEEACRNAGYLEEGQSFASNQEALDEFMKRESGLWLDAGTMFGDRCPQFERINIACPRATLTKALDRWEKALRRAR